MDFSCVCAIKWLSMNSEFTRREFNCYQSIHLRAEFWIWPPIAAHGAYRSVYRVAPIPPHAELAQRNALHGVCIRVVWWSLKIAAVGQSADWIFMVWPQSRHNMCARRAYFLFIIFMCRIRIWRLEIFTASTTRFYFLRCSGTFSINSSTSHACQMWFIAER